MWGEKDIIENQLKNSKSADPKGLAAALGAALLKVYLLRTRVQWFQRTPRASDFSCAMDACRRGELLWQVFV